MRRNIQRTKRGDRALIAASLSLALLAAGCTGSTLGTGTPVPAATATATPPAPAATTTTPPAPGATATATPPTPAPPPPASPPSFKDKVASFFSGASQRDPQPVANAQPDVDCPLIDIRQGASTLTIPPPPPDGTNEAMSLKYQGDFVRAARECRIVNGQIVMKIGVQGRIIVGPAGGPGQVDVPLRIAVLNAPASGSKLIITRLIRIPVTIGNEGNVAFTHIEDNLAFPLPSSAELNSYIVYIGFDPVGAAQEDQAKGKPAAKPKLKRKPNPNAPTG
jgi:hypothetical protein